MVKSLHLWFITALIVIGGVILQLTVGYDALARAGCLVVAFALVSLSFAEKRNTRYFAKFFEPKQDDEVFDIEDVLETGFGKEEGKSIKEQILELVEISDQRDRLAANLPTTNIRIGVVGTLLWGFGDLLPEGVLC